MPGTVWASRSTNRSRTSRTSIRSSPGGSVSSRAVCSNDGEHPSSSPRAREGLRLWRVRNEPQQVEDQRDRQARRRLCRARRVLEMRDEHHPARLRRRAAVAEREGLAATHGWLRDLRAQRLPLADVDVQDDVRLAFRAHDAHDIGVVALADHADLRLAVVRSAHATVVVLRALLEKTKDVHRRSSIPLGSRPSRQAKNEYWSARSSTCLSSGLPTPCPASRSTRSNTTASGSFAVTLCMSAVILRACIGSTRLSPSAVVNSTAG